jgi:hypothetical protein|tara:strand:- start:348 stop:566 length:219 start_codon:yes stop_codon:yes gene_type:complete
MEDIEDNDDDENPNYNFSDDIKEGIKDIEEIRDLLQFSEIGIPFNTNILKISLNFGEEMIAQTLVFNYQVSV